MGDRFLLVLSLNIFLLCSLSISAQNSQKAELYVESGHSGAVKSIVFSSDGKLVISGSRDKTIRIWNVATGKELKKLPNLCCNVNSIAVSPNGKVIATGSGNKNISLWNIFSGKEIKIFRGHEQRVFSVVFSPDGKTLVSASQDKTIKLWDVASGKELRTLPIETRDEYGEPDDIPIAFSSDGKTLATGNYSELIVLWDIQSGRKLKTFKVKEEQNNILTIVSAISFSPDGKIIAGAASNNIVHLWDVDSGRTLNILSRELKPDEKEAKDYYSPRFYSVSFSPDGKYLAAAGDQGFLGLWDTETGKELRNFEGHAKGVNSVAFSPNGKLLASGGDDNKLKLWDLASGKEIETSYNESSPTDTKTSLNGRYIAFGAGNDVVLWCLGAEVNVKYLKGHKEEVSRVVFSSKQDLLASGDASGEVKLWDLKSGMEKQINQKGSIIFSFTPDGKFLACLDTAGNITFWDVSSGSEVKTLQLKKAAMSMIMTFTPDGKKVAVGDKTVFLFDIESQTLLKEFSGHSKSVVDVVFSPDGKTMATSDVFDQKIKLWNVDSGKELKTFNRNAEGVAQEVLDVVPDFYLQSRFSSAFSYNNKFKVRADDGHINIYLPDSDKILASLFVLGVNNWVVTTPDGRFDTNKFLDNIQGLHWIVNDEILKPLPLDIFLRQYYEPNLLQRVMADEKFKTLPSIASINRVQPKVALKNIKPAGGLRDSIDVTVEVESVEEEISLRAVNRTAKKDFLQERLT